MREKNRSSRTFPAKPCRSIVHTPAPDVRGSRSRSPRVCPLSPRKIAYRLQPSKPSSVPTFGLTIQRGAEQTQLPPWSRGYSGRRATPRAELTLTRLPTASFAAGIPSDEAEAAMLADSCVPFDAPRSSRRCAQPVRELEAAFKATAYGLAIGSFEGLLADHARLRNRPASRRRVSPFVAILLVLLGAALVPADRRAKPRKASPGRARRRERCAANDACDLNSRHPPALKNYSPIIMADLDAPPFGPRSPR